MAAKKSIRNIVAIETDPLHFVYTKVRAVSHTEDAEDNVHNPDTDETEQMEQ